MPVYSIIYAIILQTITNAYNFEKVSSRIIMEFKEIDFFIKNLC